ncbi:GyrI-like domain-containing protein [Pseudonocardia sp. TRM90224]|uniref:GyrI-like domain-containing protein n=1 Tax=Pseudonocardia sp. TRM90224 TaxID=2812678 RepID=UPI001E339276|nr:GyrI-like domain-containing protein [Pseudonocardia sp. TRM90224]
MTTDVPTVVEWTEQPYVAVSGRVTMQTFGKIADRFGEVFGFLAARRIAPSGPPFFRYRVIDMEHELEVEAGVPVAVPVTGEGDVVVDVLPPGRYVTLTHTGHPDELVDRTGQLLAWASEQGLELDVHPGDRGDEWGSRLEVLLTDPAEEPDMHRWQTELAMKLA